MDPTSAAILQGIGRLEAKAEAHDKEFTLLREDLRTGLNFVHTEHSALEERVRTVENKSWFVAGAGTLLGGVAGFLVELWKHSGK
jgi:hypothetical protein